MSNSLFARIINMHDVESNWNRTNNFIPRAGEYIVYDPDEYHSYSRFKIGDGKTNVIDLPFSADSSLDGIIQWEDRIGLIDGGKIV